MHAFCSTGAAEPTLCSPGTVQPNASQGTCASCEAGTYQGGEGVARPFKTGGDNAFAMACGFSLQAVFFFSVILKVGVLTEAVDDVLSAQLRRRWP